MKAASHIQAKNSSGRGAGKAEKPQPASPGKGKPQLTGREAAGGKGGLLPSPRTPKGHAAQPRAMMQDSPYRQPARKPAAEPPRYAAVHLASLRAYLQTLKPDNLANSIFREQSSAAKNFPSTWIAQVGLAGGNGRQDAAGHPVGGA
ncbi:MAG: hypothetical protein ABWY05_05640 [Noviherbaspirillum sp.]